MLNEFFTSQREEHYPTSLLQVGFHQRIEEAARYYLSAFTKGERDRYFYRRQTELIIAIRKYILRLKKSLRASFNRLYAVDFFR